MWSNAFWPRVRASEIADEIEALRTGTLKSMLLAVTIVYLAWNTVETVASADDRIRYWLLFPIVVGGLLLAHLLSLRNVDASAVAFLGSSVVSITMAAVILQAPATVLLYPIVALAAVVLFDPLVGLLTGVVSVLVLLSLWYLGPLAYVTGDRLVEMVIASALAVAVPSGLWRNTLVAVEWSLHGFAQAQRNTEEARAHRAQLVQAMKQLDLAYYRLERANAALEIAWRAADDSERSKSEFVTNISHELRTPLNLIVGFSELIATSPVSYGGPLPPAYRGDVFAIYRSAQHLLTLTDDVIDLAKVGAGRLSLAREPLDIGQTIADARDLVREYLEAKGLSLRLEVEPGLPTVSADRLRIRQVLLNLLTNAARFTVHGGITVKVSSSPGRVTVKVADTGCGIQPEDLPRVFQEFHHGGDLNSREHKGFGGIGLGLPISRTFVELHGGQMGVESVVGQGTTFWFTLPVDAVTGATAGMTQGSPPHRQPPATGERVLVLVAEEPSVARFLRSHLRSLRIVYVADPIAAIPTALESRAVAILVDPDTVWPVEPSAAPVPVLRIPLPHGDRVASTLGAHDCLIKPLGRSDLQAAIAGLRRSVESVLVVDDDPVFVDLVTRFLRSDARLPDCRVLTAYGGAEALARMRVDRPDLVLLDLAMPEVDGAAVLAAMKQDPRLADVAVIVISGQEHEGWQMAQKRDVTIERSDGFGLEELLRLIEMAANALEPPRAYL